MVKAGNQEPDMSKATLKIEARTRDELKMLSTNMEDTFDTIIRRLITEHHELESLKKKKDL